MNRLHALVLSVVLGACGVAGAVAATHTMHLGIASAAPAKTNTPALRARSRRLDAWAKSLRGSLKKQPPALPQVPQYGAVAIPAYTPVATPAVLRTAKPTTAPKRSRVEAARRQTPVRAATPSAHAPTTGTPRDEPAEPADQPTTTSTPTTTASPPAIAPPSAPPAPATSSTTTPTTTQSHGGDGGGGGDHGSDDGPGGD